jgi:hypothetical protein
MAPRTRRTPLLGLALHEQEVALRDERLGHVRLERRAAAGGQRLLDVGGIDLEAQMPA